MDLKLLLIWFCEMVLNLSFSYAWSDSDSSDSGDLSWNNFPIRRDSGDLSWIPHYFPIRRAYKTCYFLVDKTYRAGEYEIIINTDIPTFNLFSDGFVTFDSRINGMEYRVTNVRYLTAGLHFMKYTVNFYGWNRPNCWCFSPEQNINPSTSLPLQIATTERPSTESTKKPVVTTTTTSPTTISNIIYGTSTDKKTSPKGTTLSLTTLPIKKNAFTVYFPTLPWLPTRKPTTTVSFTKLPTRKPTTTVSFTKLPTRKPTTTVSFTTLPTRQPTTTVSFTKLPTRKPTTTVSFTKLPTRKPTTTMSFTALPKRKPAPESS